MPVITRLLLPIRLPTTVEALGQSIREQATDDYISILEAALLIPETRIELIASKPSLILEAFARKYITYSQNRDIRK
jgi:hypothetical protein